MERNFGTAGKSSPRPATSARKGRQEMKTTVLAIRGMHCDGCARTVEALLARVAGVRKAEASFEERQARVLHDQEKAPEADLVTAIAKGGFEARSEELRVGKECVSTCRSRWARYHKKQTNS